MLIICFYIFISFLAAMEINIQRFLVASLRQDNDPYKNVINANHKYPCGLCQKNVNWNQKAVECTQCKSWIHIKCNGTSELEYDKMM